MKESETKSFSLSIHRLITSSPFFWTRLISHDRLERHFAYLFAFCCTLATLFLLLKPVPTPGSFLPPLISWGSPLCTFWVLLVVAISYLQLQCEQRNKRVISETLKLALQVTLMLCVLTFYEGSNVVQRYRYSLFKDAMLYDSHLLRIDNFFLGWLCPQGQIALCLDGHTLIGAKTLLGAALAEVLQIMYVSYYFWGNGLGVWLALQYFYVTQIRNVKNTIESRNVQWRRIQMFLCAWVGGFMANFVLNILFPAVSPRIHLKNQFHNEIVGLFFANTLKQAIASAAASTFSAFPSGHCGLSWLVPIMAHRMGYLRFRNITIIAATLITMATIILRYHYFADFLFSLLIIGFAAWFGGFITEATYDECLYGSSSNGNKNRKGKPYDMEKTLNSLLEPDEDDDFDLEDSVPLMSIKVPHENDTNGEETERPDSVDAVSETKMSPAPSLTGRQSSISSSPRLP